MMGRGRLEKRGFPANRDWKSMILYSTCDGMKYMTSSTISQPEWGRVAMVRWGKEDWLYVVKKKRALDSSFSDIDVRTLSHPYCSRKSEETFSFLLHHQ